MRLFGMDPNSPSFVPSGRNNISEFTFPTEDPASSEFVTKEALENSFASLEQKLTARLEKSVAAAISAVIPAPVFTAADINPSPTAGPISGSLADSKGKAPIVPPVGGSASSSTFVGKPSGAPDPADPPSSTVDKLPVDFNNQPYLPVDYFARYIADGFRERPYPGADDKPHRFSLALDPTEQRIVQKFSKLPAHKNETLLEYQTLYCYTFYLSCCEAALTAACSEGYGLGPGGNGVVISRDQFEIIASATKTLAAVESSFRDRLAYIKYKHDPQKDPYFEAFSAQRLHKPDLSFAGSLNLQGLQDLYESECQKQSVIQLAKAAVAKGKGKNPLRSADDSRKEDSDKKKGS